MMELYILDENKITKRVDDIGDWVEWFDKFDRKVRFSNCEISVGGQKLGIIKISTVFLGMDHGVNSDKPVLFETMVFGGPLDGEVDRCCTWEAAEKMHEKMEERVKLAIKELRV